MMKRHFSRLEKRLAEYIALGQEQGEFRTDLPPEQLAAAFSVYVSGMLARAREPHSKKRTERLVCCGLQLLSAT